MDTETADVIRELRDLLEDAHDTHIFAPDDPHPEDCYYCKTVAWANRVLAAHNQELEVPLA